MILANSVRCRPPLYIILQQALLRHHGYDSALALYTVVVPIWLMPDRRIEAQSDG